MSVWIFKDLVKAREKGIQGERKYRANTSDLEERCNQRGLGPDQIKVNKPLQDIILDQARSVVRRCFHFLFYLTR